MPKPDLTPEQLMAEMLKSVGLLEQAAPEIARAKRTLYLAYIDEGFSEAQALMLVKDISRI